MFTPNNVAHVAVVVGWQRSESQRRDTHRRAGGRCDVTVRSIHRWLAAGCSHLDDELGIDEREAGELGLVEVHDEELVGGRQLGLLARELVVEVAHVFAAFLQQSRQR